jgi:glycerol-1-phosphate dehydrogenase [NAD(P)+]
MRPRVTDPLAELLAGTWIDPDSGEPTGVAIDAIVIDRSLRGREADCVAALKLGNRIAVVSDAITHDVLGARIERALAPLARVDSVVLPSGVHPDIPAVETVRAGTAGADALIAVGSGTINDLTKFAAATDRKPFAVFPTAPSMNGYTSANAAITVGGHKKTLPAALTRGVFIDLEILAAAPARMIRAGLGDSLCRPTAQVDWLLSHHVLGTKYREAPFALLAGDEPILFGSPEALLDGDLNAMRALARTLLLSGIGMTLCGGSYPASQGEHLISHYIDMCAPTTRTPTLHGEQVAVATLTLARLQEAMLDAPPPTLSASTTTQQALERHFGPEVGTACWHDYSTKHLDAQGARALNVRIATEWPALRRRANAARIASPHLAEVMRRAGGPTSPTDLAIDAAFYDGAVRHARYLRDRFTFLDLAGDAGMLAGPPAA